MNLRHDMYPAPKLRHNKKKLVFIVTKETLYILLEILSHYKYNTKFIAKDLEDNEHIIIAIPISKNRK